MPMHPPRQGRAHECFSMAEPGTAWIHSAIRGPARKAARIPREWSPVGRASVRHPAIGRCTSRLLIGSASWPVAAAVAYRVLWIAVSATSAPQRRQHPSWCPTTLVSASLSALVAISRFHLLVWWWLAHGEVEGQFIGAAIGQVYPLAAMWAHQVGRPRTAAKGPGRSSAPGSPSIHPSPAVFDLHTLRGLALNDLPNHVGCHAARHVRGEKSSAFSTGS